MLPQKEVERFQHRSNLRDVAVAEREIVLTYALQIVYETGLGERLAFKGGTCIRKVHTGTSGRFSMDLDFTHRNPEWINPDDFIADRLLEAFNRERWDIQFELSLDDEDFWVARDRRSFTVRPRYRHPWRQRSSRFDFQVSLRAEPILPPRRMRLLDPGYFGKLEFVPAPTVCLRFEEILAEKIRACYQRFTVRDLYDLYLMGQ